jgi:apolipoprotein N-acyltransferase
MLGASFPPSPFGLFACFGLIPLLVVLENLEKHSLRYIYLAMFVFHLITLNWTGGYAHMNDPYMMIAGGVTMTVHPFFYFVPLGVYVVVKKKLGSTLALVSLPFLWVAYEYSHTLSEWSFPWITLGNSQSYDIARIQFIEYTGVIGLSLWIVSLNVLGFQLYKSFLANGMTFRSRLNVSLVAILLLIYFIPTIHGRIVLSSNPQSTIRNPQSRAGINVGIVQSNVDPWEKWKHTGFETVELYLRMTDSLVKLHSTQKPALVLWPETAMPHHVLLQQNKSSLTMIRERVDSLGVPVLFGLPHAVFYDDTTTAPPSAKRIQATGERYDAFNAEAFVQPDVEEVPWYGKMKFVPIAERVPYADAFYFFDFLRWGVGIGGWQIGRDSVIFQEKKTGAKFSSMICYESVYPEFVASFVKKGAEFICIITIDSWWAYMSGAYQHHQYAIFRAIENRRWIARCAVGGFSSFIDPMGHVYDKTELFTQAVLNTTIERRTELTFYTRYGEWVGQLCAICSGVFLLIALVKRKEFAVI